jgi:hypothetical protein
VAKLREAEWMRGDDVWRAWKALNFVDRASVGSIWKGSKRLAWGANAQWRRVCV